MANVRDEKYDYSIQHYTDACAIEDHKNAIEVLMVIYRELQAYHSQNITAALLHKGEAAKVISERLKDYTKFYDLICLRIYQYAEANDYVLPQSYREMLE